LHEVVGDGVSVISTFAGLEEEQPQITATTMQTMLDLVSRIGRLSRPRSAWSSAGEIDFGPHGCHNRHMDRLTAFGLFAVTSMLVTYALEERSHWFTLAFAGSCVMGSAYGFLQGAWPFGLVEGVWSLVALRKWWGNRLIGREK
jgi:hypothetical protein